jgi:hypothetical protein
MAGRSNLNRRRRLKNETQGRAAPATPKTGASTETRLQKAKRQTREGKLRVFAGETHEQALTRKNEGLKGVRPEQVAITTGGARGQSTVGITGPTSGRGTRGGLAIN